MKNLATENKTDFSVNKENNTIHIKRVFDAEISLVWDAYTKSEILDQWWAPKPWKTETKSQDFKEGGRWMYAMVSPEGEKHWCLANYSAIQAKTVNGQRRYTGKDAFADENGNVNKNMPQSTWDITFVEKGNQTLVDITITYPDLSQLEAVIKMGFKEGLSMAMDNLDALLPELKK